MINVSMEMEQYDCPFVHASDRHEVAFSSVHCDTGPDRTEVRMVAEATDRDALESGLSAVRNNEGVRDYELFSKVDNVAKFRTVVGPTAAMGVVHDHDGYITGPFYAEAGTETWHVGFDEPDRADGALAALERSHEFDVVGRDDTDEAELHFPPRVVCPECTSDDLDYVSLPHEGTLFAFSTVRGSGPLGMTDDVPFVTGVVELDGVDLRLSARIDGAEYDDLAIGDPVELEVVDIDGPTDQHRVFYRFRPRGETA